MYRLIARACLTSEFDFVLVSTDGGFGIATSCGKNCRVDLSVLSADIA